MANDRYIKELRKIMQNDKPAREMSRTTEELECAIANISVQLKGHLSNFDRLCLIEERVELRKVLASRLGASR